jgi:CheY-like chemotaxis protein
MPILIIAEPRSMDRGLLRTLTRRGYRLTTTETARKAVELIHQTKFDCILIDIATSATCGGLVEIRQFIRTSAVVLMTGVPVESLIHEALAEGSIELVSVGVLRKKIDQLSHPALLVGASFHPELIQALKSKGLLFAYGTTLQFAMNLLVDGWCQIVLLTADIPGMTDANELAIFHQANTKQLAILASALPGTPSAIICIDKPQKAEDYIALFEQIAAYRTGA